MNSTHLKAAGIDYEQGVRRFSGRAHLYEKTLAKFPADKTFARIRAAYDLDDRAQMFDGAHEFKGMCGNIALTRLYELSDALVLLLRSGTCSREALRASYDPLEREYARACAAIRAAMEDVPARA